LERFEVENEIIININIDIMGLLGYYFAIFMLVLAAVTFLQFVYSEIKRRQVRLIARSLD